MKEMLFNLSASGKKIKVHLLIILIGAFLAVIFTWPLITKLSTFYSDYGDFPLNGTTLWYNQDAIKTGKIFNQKEYFKGYEFYPQPYTLAYADHSIVPSIIFSPIYWISNNLIFSVNMFSLLVFVLSFVTSFYTINYFIKNPFASIIGATVYAFNPLAFSRFPLHLNLLNNYFLPLVFLFAYIFLKKPNFKNSFLFFLFFTLNGLSAIYFQVFTIISLPIFALPFIIKNLKNYKYFKSIIKYSFVFIIFIPLFLYFNMPYLEFSKNEGVKRTLEGNIFFSARVIDWVSSNQESFLYGNFVKGLEPFRSPKDPNSGYFNHEEHTLFLNILPMLLFIIAIFILYLRHRRKEHNRNILAPFYLLLIIIFIFIFGPFFQGWNSFQSKDIPLPYYYLFQYVPLFNGLRAPTRFQFVFYVPFSLLVSYGAYFIFQKIKKRNLIFSLTIIFLIILFVENYNVESYNEKSKIFDKLEQINDQSNQLKFLENKNTLHLPINIPEYGNESAYSNWLTITKEKIANGNTGYLPPDQTNFLTNIKNKIDEDTLKKIIILNFDYIIIHKDLYKKELEKYNDLFKNAIVYDKHEILIVDLKKYIYQIKTCNYEKDIEKDIKVGSYYNKTFYVVLLKNKSNCYLPNISTDKYKTLELNTKDMYGNFIKRTLHIKLPLIIGPKEEIVISEITNDVRLE